MVGCAIFRTTLPKNAVELLGREVVIKVIEGGYEIAKYGIDSIGKPSILNANGTLTMPNRLVNENEDLGSYGIYIESETETVYLDK
jgi:hypothetical protein